LSLRLTETAEDDLSEIWAYLASEASEAVATRFVESIQTLFSTVQHAPSIGTRRERFAPGLRVVFQSPYAIYYLPSDQEIIIVRVLHGARDVAAIADQGGFEA
jgi:toxin ParE1/3/4